MGQIKIVEAKKFLPALIEFLPEEEVFDPETIFVFPTRRAGLFFRYYLWQKRPKTTFLPPDHEHCRFYRRIGHFY